MSIRQKNFDGLSNLRYEDHAILNGLDHFKKRLGRAYYADVEVFKISEKTSELPLVLDLYSNLSLVEVLIFHEKGMWGYIHPCTGEELETVCFDKAVDDLKAKSSQPLSIEEFNIFLSDCAIVVKSIYANSIEEELKNIFNAIGEHYVHLTHNLTKTPYEIFVPVFSEDLLPTQARLGEYNSEQSREDYYSFWGLYFAEKDDAVIYDLSKKSFISGDLYMLDQ